MAFEYAWIVPSSTDQLLPLLLLGQFDTLPIQCRHIELMHEGVWFGKNMTKLQNYSYVCLFVLFVLLLYVPSQQLWSLRDGQFT